MSNKKINWINSENVPQFNKSFYGRIEEINKMNQLFKNNNKLIVIRGFGGIGKTRLVLEFLTNHGSDFDSVLWIDGQTKDSVLKSFNQIPNQNSMKQIADTTYKSLKNDKNLVVFECSFDYKSIIDILPDMNIYKNIFCLITTRHVDEQFLKNCSVIDLDVLSKEDSITFIKSDVRIVSDEFTTNVKLVETLGCFPLALQQASSYINHENITIEKYLDIFRQNPHMLLNYKSSNDTHDQFYYEKPIYEIVSILLHLSQIVDGKIFDIIRILSILSHAHISMQRFHSISFDEKTFDTLKKFYLVKINDNNIHMNGLIRLTLKVYMEKNCRDSLLKNSTDFFKNFKDISENEINITISRELIPHIESYIAYLEKLCESIEGDDLMKIKYEHIGQCYEILTCFSNNLRDHEKSKIVLEKLLFLLREKGEEKSMVMAKTLFDLAMCESSTRNRNNANLLFERSFAVYNVLLDEMDPFFSYFYKRWADNNTELGKTDEAQLLLEKARKIIENIKVDTKITMGNLLRSMANNFIEMGKHLEAENTFKEAYGLLSSKVDKNHIILKYTLQGWAINDECRGSFRNAYLKYINILPTFVNIHGRTHILTNTISNDLLRVKRKLVEGSSFDVDMLSENEQASNDLEQELTINVEKYNDIFEKVKKEFVKFENQYVDIFISAFDVSKTQIMENRLTELENYCSSVEKVIKASTNKSVGIIEKFPGIAENDSESIDKLQKTFQDISKNILNESLRNHLKKSRFLCSWIDEMKTKTCERKLDTKIENINTIIESHEYIGEEIHAKKSEIVTFDETAKDFVKQMDFQSKSIKCESILLKNSYDHLKEIWNEKKELLKMFKKFPEWSKNIDIKLEKNTFDNKKSSIKNFLQKISIIIKEINGKYETINKLQYLNLNMNLKIDQILKYENMNNNDSFLSQIEALIKTYDRPEDFEEFMLNTYNLTFNYVRPSEENDFRSFDDEIAYCLKILESKVIENLKLLQSVEGKNNVRWKDEVIRTIPVHDDNMTSDGEYEDISDDGLSRTSSKRGNSNRGSQFSINSLNANDANVNIINKFKLFDCNVL